MGRFLNPGNKAFQKTLKSEIYVDKTMLLAYTNKVIGSDMACICNSRPRRFGKSITANMLAAYYSRGCDSFDMFSTLNVGRLDSFETNLNKYDVIHIDVQWCMMDAGEVQNTVKYINNGILDELIIAYGDVIPDTVKTAYGAMSYINAATGNTFVIIIDEWDVLIRDEANNKELQEEYINFLRGMFKGTEPTKYIALAYLTGILPIKKLKTQSALNNFEEFTMLDAGALASYIGFTDDEVRELCDRYDMDFEEARAWYNGYKLVSHSKYGVKKYAMYSPKSVVEAMLKHKFGTYWNQTETYEALKVYIQMNMDGLKDAVIKMLAGESEKINTGTFENDMTSFATKDDVLTLLVHLGYLTYDSETEEVSIPNREVSKEYLNAISTMDWDEVSKSIKASQKLLESLWNMNGAAVADGIDKAHNEISILRYNDENSLSCTINLAFYSAREYYSIVRELPTGKGFADVCFIPRVSHLDKPAVVIELKYDKNVDGAISQIKSRQYVEALKDYKGNLLLVGINYDKKTKEHQCVIEKWKL